MRLKHNKEFVLSNIDNAIHNHLEEALMHIAHPHNPGPNMIAMKYAIQRAVLAGFQQLLIDSYTDEDAEQDLGLPKI